jgi:hypothetical protein
MEPICSPKKLLVNDYFAQSRILTLIFAAQA